MPLTQNAQRLVNNIKALNQTSFAALSDHLFKNKNRAYIAWTAIFFGGKTTWPKTPYTDSFVDAQGNTFNHVLRTVFTGSGGNTVTDWTQADSESLVTELYRVNPSSNQFLRNLLFGMKARNRTLAVSTNQFPLFDNTNPPID